MYDLAMWRVLNVHPDTGKFPKDLYTFPLPVTSDIRSITVSFGMHSREAVMERLNNLTDIRNGLELEHLTLQQQHGSSNTLQLLSIVSINGAMQQKTYGSIHHYNMLVMPTMKEHPTSTHTNY